mgnify:CR=1 FL=1
MHAPLAAWVSILYCHGAVYGGKNATPFIRYRYSVLFKVFLDLLLGCSDRGQPYGILDFPQGHQHSP